MGWERALEKLKLKRHRRESKIGDWSAPNDGDGEADVGEDRLERRALECYSQNEVLFYGGTVNWETLFNLAGIPKKYRPSWRNYLQGADVRDIPDSHYRFILRACHADPWQSKIRAAIEQQRAIDPLFGIPRPNWNNHGELHRTLYHVGWQPVSGASVATACRAVSVSDRLYWKEDDHPGPLTSRERNVRRVIVACDGFRANFQGPSLEAHRYAPPVAVSPRNGTDRAALRNYGIYPAREQRSILPDGSRGTTTAPWHIGDELAWPYEFEPARLAHTRAAAMRNLKRDLFPGHNEQQRRRAIAAGFGSSPTLPQPRFYTWPDRRPIF